MRQVSGYPLWLGNATDLRDLRSVLALEVMAIVDLAASEPPTTVPRDIAHCRFPLVDGKGNPSWLLHSALGAVAKLIAWRTPTFVACTAGLSRSPAIVAGALSIAENIAPDESLRKITQNVPADVSPGLWHEVSEIVNAWDERAKIGCSRRDHV